MANDMEQDTENKSALDKTKKWVDIIGQVTDWLDTAIGIIKQAKDK